MAGLLLGTLIETTKTD